MSIRNRVVPRLLVPVLAVLGSSAVFAHAAAAPQSRLSAAISDTDRTSVRETIPARAKLEADQGEA
ncbi:MAG TPA: hypothetical protein VK638_25955, partial [Edaphobacter sp.]|nr:hypothetical protein [Edaphobacter sp.]